MHSVVARHFYLINPGPSWFQNFAIGFPSVDIRIWEELTDGHPRWFGLESGHLNDADLGQELADRTAALKVVFDGAMRLVYGTDYHPFGLNGPYLHETDAADGPSFQSYVSDVRVYPFSAEHVGRRFTESRPIENNAVALFVFLARYDGVVLSMLKYIGYNGFSYFSLYAVFEWMRDNGWDFSQIAGKGNWSKSMLRDFLATANNPVHLGPLSRHGGKEKLISRPVSIDTAIGPITKAATAFLFERARAVGLLEKWRAVTT